MVYFFMISSYIPLESCLLNVKLIEYDYKYSNKNVESSCPMRSYDIASGQHNFHNFLKNILHTSC